MTHLFRTEEQNMMLRRLVPHRPREELKPGLALISGPSAQRKPLPEPHQSRPQ